MGARKCIVSVNGLCVLLFVCVSLQSVYCQTGDECTRPNGEPGHCIVFQSCEFYVNILKEFSTQAMDVLRKAKCGFEGSQPKVCCPTPASPPCTPAAPVTAAKTGVAATPPPPEVVSKLGTEDFVPMFLDPPVCGLSNASFSRVVGGVDAQLDDFPWMALLGYNGSTGTNWWCGGSLISTRHVLTAAHCIHNREHKLYVVRLGELDLEREDDGAFPIDVLIKKMLAHEDYDPNTYTNDIGVLVLQNDVQFTKSIRPICLPKARQWRTETFEDYNPLIAGWGRIEHNGPSASHLQVLQVPVLNNNACTNAFKAYTTQVFDQRVICAGYTTGGKDSCQGDSGGPLMQPLWSDADKKAYFYEIGLVSYGRGCAESKFPGVYTRVTHFLPWIEQKVIGRSLG